jgi:hypothetical protein
MGEVSGQHGVPQQANIATQRSERAADGGLAVQPGAVDEEPVFNPMEEQEFESRLSRLKQAGQTLNKVRSCMACIESPR